MSDMLEQGVEARECDREVQACPCLGLPVHCPPAPAPAPGGECDPLRLTGEGARPWEVERLVPGHRALQWQYYHEHYVCLVLDLSLPKARHY